MGEIKSLPINLCQEIISEMSQKKKRGKNKVRQRK